MKTTLTTILVKSNGLTQEQMVAGIESLAVPLTSIINVSIKNGKFPSTWKEALITPVLKSGSKEILNNYRPVSCLNAASKLLEKIVCNQLTEFFEGNNLENMCEIPDHTPG